jgi:hypothetical protein
MTYALLQTTLDRPSVEALERAFASGRGLTPADARFVADDAFGILARDLADVDALFLQQALAAEGIEVNVVPESDLPKVPDVRQFCWAECAEECLRLHDARACIAQIPWHDVRIIAAGFDQRELKLDLITAATGEHFTGEMNLLQFEQMPQFLVADEPGNIGAAFTNLVRGILKRAHEALPNRAAHFLGQESLTGDVTAAITYPRPMAYTEELTWLLWRASQMDSASWESSSI